MSRRSVILIIVGIVVVIVIAVTAILIVELTPSEDDGNAEERIEPKEYCDSSKGESEICDGAKDCEDGSDEIECPGRNWTTCNGFQCSVNMTTPQCLNPNIICDGVKDCMDGNDEINCPACPTGQFRCPDPISNFSICIDAKRVCDGKLDCKLPLEESNCAKWYGWSPWCRWLSGIGGQCTLVRQRHCQHANGTIFENNKDCVIWGLNLLEDITISGISKSCASTTELDPYNIQLCPRKANSGQDEIGSASMPGEYMLAFPLGEVAEFPIVEYAGKPHTAYTSKSNDEPTKSSTSNDAMHTNSIIIACCAVALCVIAAIATYFIAHRHQYRAYNVAKKEARGMPPEYKQQKETGDDQREKRVSTSSAV